MQEELHINACTIHTTWVDGNTVSQVTLFPTMYAYYIGRWNGTIHTS